MNFELWPAVISVGSAFLTMWGLLRGRQTGSAVLLLAGLAAAVVSVVAWVWLWPEPHRTGLLDGFSSLVHSAVHLVLVGGGGLAGKKAAE